MKKLLPWVMVAALLARQRQFERTVVREILRAEGDMFEWAKRRDRELERWIKRTNSELEKAMRR